MKGPIAEGTAGRACGRVGRLRVLFQGAADRKVGGPLLFCPSLMRGPRETETAGGVIGVFRARCLLLRRFN